MHARRIHLLLFLAATLLHAPPPAGAGGGLGDLRPYDRSVPLKRDPRDLLRQPAALPDLYVRKCHYRVYGTQGFELQLTVKNVGAGSSAAFTSRVAVEVLGTTGVQNGDVRFPRIAAGSRARVTVGFFNLPDRTRDWDVRVTAKADSRGQVPETDEGNNIRTCDVERVYAL